MMNDRLQRVQVGRDDDVPIFDVWYLFIKDDGNWDAGQTNDENFMIELKDKHTKFIFAIWHGQYRTNLFLMDKDKLYKKIMKFKR